MHSQFLGNQQHTTPDEQWSKRRCDRQIERDRGMDRGTASLCHWICPDTPIKIIHQATMSNHHPLWLSRGTGSVDYICEVFRLCLAGEIRCGLPADWFPL